MPLYIKIKDSIKNAMKQRDAVTRDVLKLVVDKARTIHKGIIPNDTPDVIPDDIMLQAIKQELKQLNQTKDALTGRQETQIYTETEDKIRLLEAYLPVQMSPEEVDRAVFNILTGGNYPDFGSKMKVVMAQLKGKADNKLIRATVEKYK